MFSKIAIAAGLLSTVYAQNVSTSTVYQDVYLATTTLTADCNSACTTDAVTVSYTVVASGGTTTLVGSSAPAGATAASTSSTCGFALDVNGEVALGQISDGQIQATSLGQISDGQIQAGSNLTSSTFTISNGMVYDQAGRICSISGQNQAQFQCNYVPTTGSTTTTFSLVDGDLAFNGNTTFYACLLGGAGDGYNIYQTLTGAQSSCTAITLVADGATDCSTDDESTTPAATATATAVSPVATTAAAVTTPVVVATTAASVASASTALPAVTSAATVPISTGAAATLSSKSLSAFILSAAFAYFLL